MKHHHHHSKRFCIWCLLTTIGFPLEHLVWEKLWPLSLVTRLLGL